MPNVFSPQVGGFAQENYFDQIATALPGQLAFASDHNLVDSYVVAADIGANGLEAGVFVCARDIPADQIQRPGINQLEIYAPGTVDDSTVFFGITVRNQQMDSNVNGNACWFGGRMCSVLRLTRVGGRVWVRLADGQTATAGSAATALAGGEAGMTGEVVPGAFFTSTAESSAAIAMVEVGRRD